ncbi:MAG TPA: hypothetical protein DDW52_26905 [Planctomycetaceae bacterium]|nr:hypothetical protein [Planctomycetaceae bacterium]
MKIFKPQILVAAISGFLVALPQFAFGQLQTGAPTDAATGGTATTPTISGSARQPFQGLQSGFGASAQQTPFGSTALGVGTAVGLGNSFGNAFGGFGGFGGGFGGFGGGFGGAGFGQTQNQTPIPFTLKLGFRPKLKPTEQVVREVKARLTRIPLPPKFDRVMIDVQAGTAVLRGNVPTRDDAQVAEKLLLLEPGISTVKNELVWQTENAWDDEL